MEKEINEFADAIGAKEPNPTEQSHIAFRALFPRHNYFLLNRKFIIIKISRSKRPFWGIGKKYIDFLNDFDYFLILLTSNNSGYVFSKQEVNARIKDNTWRLYVKDNN